MRNLELPLDKEGGGDSKNNREKTKHAMLKDFDTSFDINFDLYK